MTLAAPLLSNLLCQQVIEHSAAGMAVLSFVRDSQQNPIDAQFLYANPAFCEILRYSPQQLVKLTLASVSSSSGAFEQLQYVLPQLEWDTTTPIHVDFCCHTQYHRLVWVNTSFVLTSLSHNSDSDRFIILTLRDITLQQTDHQALAEAKQMAESSNRAKSEFLAVMSHEIRTPLNAIVGMVTLISDTVLTPEQRDFIGTIRSSSEALLNTISDILDFSKIESGKLDLEASPFALLNCVKTAVDLFVPQASLKGIGLSWSHDPDIPTHYQGDETRLRQVIVNLISNAVKFTDEGEITVHVQAKPLMGRSIDSEPQTTPLVSPLHNISISVRDTGIGIPKNQQAALFQSFNQADTSITRRYGGTGLGLAICKKLTEKMGGGILLESEPGKGTCFTVQIVLPTAKPSSLPHAANPSANWQARLEVRWEGETTQAIYLNNEITTIGRGISNRLVLGDTMVSRCHAQVVMSNDCYWLTDLNSSNGTFLNDKPLVPHKPYPLTNDDSIRIGVFHLLFSRHELSSEELKPQALKILVAEDNRINQQVIMRLLKKLSYEVDIVNNGREAVERLREEDYNVVLMDLEMPEMDGITATKTINAEWAQRSQTKIYPVRPWIVALTAYATEEDRERCKEAGMNGYLTKPIRLPELERTLTQCGLLLFGDKQNQDSTWITGDSKR